MKLRALDLFCGAGGASRGLQDAGFHVIGVDLAPQPRYCGDSLMAWNVMGMEAHDLYPFDLIWASPPCQAHTSLKGMHNAKQHVDLIPATRALLKASGIPYVIENVIGAPLVDPFILCGTMFDLGVDDAELRRHRQFETNFPVMVPTCQHGGKQTIGVYGGHVRNRKRVIGVYGEGCRDSRRKFDKGYPDFSIEDGRKAMGIDWMTTAELSQAIPPAYSKFIAEQWMAQRDERLAA